MPQVGELFIGARKAKPSQIGDSSREQVWDRLKRNTGYTCHFCGVESPKHILVHALDDNPDHLTLSNLITVCRLCHWTLHLNLAPPNSFVLVPAPPVSQAHINHLCRLHHVAQTQSAHADMNNDDFLAFKKLLDDTFTALCSTRDALIQSFGNSVDFTQDMVSLLLNMNDAEYRQRARHVTKLRVIWHRTAFQPDELAYYANKEMQAFDWRKMALT